jgi:hypothetical protein
MTTTMLHYPVGGAVYSQVVYSSLADSAVAAAPLEEVLPEAVDSADLAAAVLLVAVEPAVAGNTIIHAEFPLLF